jgi:hypothetical protein
MKKVLIMTITLIIVLTSSMAFAYDDADATNVLADAIILRPMGIGALAFGSIFYVISLPFALMTDSNDRTLEVLVKEPFEYSFLRPMGQIGSGL